MSKHDEPLKIEVLGNALVIDPIIPDTKAEKSLKASGMKPISAPDPKNKLWSDSQDRKHISEWDEHPLQGIVKGMSEKAKQDLPSIKLNDHVGLRVGSGEPIIYQNHIYWRAAPHEILFKYLGNKA